MDPTAERPVEGRAPASPGPGATTEPTTPARQIDYQAHGRILMDRCIADAKNNTARLLRDRQDILNLRFDRGGRDNHWCIWDNGTNRYVPRPENPDQGGLPAWVPRPVTNMFRIVVRGLTSILDQSEPAQVYGPRTDSDEDKATADVAEDAVPVLREECGYDSEGHRHQLNSLATKTDKAAYVLYYDSDEKYGTEDVAMFTCLECNAQVMPMEVEDADGCPHCGNQDTENAFEPFTVDGVAQGAPMPIGKICAEVLSSFEFSLPSSARNPNAKAVPWILLHNRMTPSDILRMWGDKYPGLADLVNNKANWADGALTRAYADEMRRLSSPQSGGASLGGGSVGQDGPVVYRLQHDPIVDHEVNLPEGCYGVYLANTLIDAGPLPYTDGNPDSPRPMKNFLIRTWDTDGQNAFGHPPADDLVPIQQSRNLTEAMIELIIMHDAAPTRYIPDTVTLLDELTGVPGENVRYRSIDGQKPTESRGQNPPEALFARLDNLDAKMEKVSGLNSVLQGERPEGDPTLGEVEILEQRGMATFHSPLGALIDFEKDLSFMLLAIARQSAWSPRFRRIRGENGQWELKQFAAADLTGQIDIVVARASAWPKNPVLQQLKLEKALALGVLPPPATDPELQGKLLVEMNLANLKPSWDVDRRQVGRELERWKAATTPDQIRPVNPVTSNLTLHRYLKQAFLKSEEAEILAEQNPAVYGAMVQHVANLQIMTQPALPAGPGGAPAPAGPEGGGAPTAPAPGGGGTLDQAIQSRVLTPDTGEAGQGGTLDEAIQAGVLVPDGADSDAPPMAPAPPMAAGPSIDQITEALLQQPLPQPGEPPPDPLGGAPV